MKRVLCILSSMNAGGAETFLMKVYRQLDKTQYQMDFCINEPKECYYEQEIRMLGGRLYRIPSKSESVLQFSKELKKVIRDNGYEYVLRVTSNAMGFMDLMIAKQAGAKRCIARSSNSSDGDGFKTWFAHQLGRRLYGRFVDVKIAPSELAAAYTFGRKSVEQKQVFMLRNGLNLETYCYDPYGRQVIRAELGIEQDALVVGHVGRFTAQKNHRFVLESFAVIQKKNPSARLLLVGRGELEDEIHQQVENLGLNGTVIFCGIRSDIPRILSAMDVFLFPSLYEGMPNTVVVAQATGLPCVIADTITKEADLTGLVNYLPLSAPAEYWASIVLQNIGNRRVNVQQDFINHGYDIQTVAREFELIVFE